MTTLTHAELGVILTVRLIDQSPKFWIVQTPGQEERGAYVLPKARWRQG